MPTYEYQCKGCDHEFERDQRITDKPVKKCPACGALKARRMIPRTSFVLKGSGWYNDLYSSSGGTKPEGTDAGKGDSASSDSKTEAKGDAKEASSSKSASTGKKSSKGGGSKASKNGKSAA